MTINMIIRGTFNHLLLLYQESVNLRICESLLRIRLSVHLPQWDGWCRPLLVQQVKHNRPAPPFHFSKNDNLSSSSSIKKNMIMCYYFRLFQLSRQTGRTTTPSIWHGGWRTDLEGIRGNVECDVRKVWHPPGSLQNARWYHSVRRGQALVDDERECRTGRWLTCTNAWLARGIGVYDKERDPCISDPRSRFVIHCRMIAHRVTWFLNFDWFLPIKSCVEWLSFVTWFPIIQRLIFKLNRRIPWLMQIIAFESNDFLSLSCKNHSDWI